MFRWISAARIIQLDMVLIHKESRGMMDRRLLHLIRLFGFTAEGTLVHEDDLLCEEFRLGSDGVKLQLQAFDDGDKDMLVHPVKLFIGKRENLSCHTSFLYEMIITEIQQTCHFQASGYGDRVCNTQIVRFARLMQYTGNRWSDGNDVVKCRLDVILFEAVLPVVVGMDGVAVLIAPLLYGETDLGLFLTEYSPLVEFDLLQLFCSVHENLLI